MSAVIDQSRASFPVFDESKSGHGWTLPRVRSFTWSAVLRQFVATYHSELRATSRPALIDVRGCEPYGWTYDAPMSRLGWLCARERRMLAGALDTLTPGPDVWILDRLIDDEIDSRTLVALFVLFRACLVDMSGIPSRAMCRPVAPASRDRGFPLHADLYVHHKLLLAFDDVVDFGGASLFLSVDTLEHLLGSIRSCPATARRRIVSMLRRRQGPDRFDELYGLLHNRHNPWVPELERRMADNQIVLQLGRGQGYLIDDRVWLHGRSPSSIPVTARRFRRLAF